jgi:hypothetical protein
MPTRPDEQFSYVLIFVIVSVVALFIEAAILWVACRWYNVISGAAQNRPTQPRAEDALDALPQYDPTAPRTPQRQPEPAIQEPTSPPMAYPPEEDDFASVGPPTQAISRPRPKIPEGIPNPSFGRALLIAVVGMLLGSLVLLPIDMVARIILDIDGTSSQPIPAPRPAPGQRAPIVPALPYSLEVLLGLGCFMLLVLLLVRVLVRAAMLPTPFGRALVLCLFEILLDISVGLVLGAFGAGCILLGWGFRGG